MGSIAIVPAAGLSRRMGASDKLALPWGQSTIFANVIGAWMASDVDEVIVVSRYDAQHVAEVCESFKAHLVIPDNAPQDMRESLVYGLDYARDRLSLGSQVFALFAPADLPTLSTSLLNAVIHGANNAGGKAVIPRFLRSNLESNAEPADWKEGHPVSVPLSLLTRLKELPPDKNLKHLLTSLDRVFIDLPGHLYPFDVDTPAEYEKALVQQRRDS